jgi:ABC-type phosphate transport system substrate-binding protein
LLTCIGSSVVANDPEDILVVVNVSVAEKSVELEELRTIFLKMRTSWRSGGKVVPINPKNGSALRRQFQERVLGMSADEEKSYWEKQKITKGVEPPPEFTNTLKAVFRIKGSVTYIYRSQYREGVSKVLYVLPR